MTNYHHLKMLFLLHTRYHCHQRKNCLYFLSSTGVETDPSPSPVDPKLLLISDFNKELKPTKERMLPPFDESFFECLLVKLLLLIAPTDATCTSASILAFAFIRDSPEDAKSIIIKYGSFLQTMTKQR